MDPVLAAEQRRMDREEMIGGQRRGCCGLLVSHRGLSFSHHGRRDPSGSEVSRGCCFWRVRWKTEIKSCSATYHLTLEPSCSPFWAPAILGEILQPRGHCCAFVKFGMGSTEYTKKRAMLKISKKVISWRWLAIGHTPDAGRPNYAIWVDMTHDAGSALKRQSQARYGHHFW
jgi:hypothetical protein